MRIAELRPGLHRWTADHPDAEADPQPGSPADWGPEVGSVAYGAPDALLLVDPLVPADGWAGLDELVERHGQPVSVLTTIRFHGRSRAPVIARYGASTSVPDGVEIISLPEAGETLIWLPAPRALVPGDRILGDDADGLRLCPESWLRYLPSGITRAQLREALVPLLELPIELVLASHGEPVLDGGSEALARALEAV